MSQEQRREYLLRAAFRAEQNGEYRVARSLRRMADDILPIHPSRAIRLAAESASWTLRTLMLRSMRLTMPARIALAPISTPSAMPIWATCLTDLLHNTAPVTWALRAARISREE